MSDAHAFACGAIAILAFAVLVALLARLFFRTDWSVEPFPESELHERIDAKLQEER